jgi:ABC-2 type transport system ATP-binding protein
MIRAQNLSKYFGTTRALGPVSFEIDDGETVGFLGLNGAGKTTALRIFSCDLRPSSGTVVVEDIDAVQSPHEVRKRIGFLPEKPPLYPDMTVSEFLTYAGRLRGMSASEVDKRLPEVIEATDLGERTEWIIGHLSHGFQQRVGLAQAIIHEPSLLILDEPTRGLDPVQIVEMRDLINNLKEKHTVLISSHILTEISETCDRLLVLGRGEIIAEGTEAELAGKLAEVARVHIEVTVRPRPPDGGDPYRDGPGPAPTGAAITKDIEGVDGVLECSYREEGDELVFRVVAEDDVRADVCRALVKAGQDVLELSRSERELENIFIRLVQGGNDARN